MGNIVGVANTIYDESKGQLSFEMTDNTKVGPFKIKGSKGDAGPAGPTGPTGKDGKDGIVDTSKTLWCADGQVCTVPTGVKKINWGAHILDTTKYDGDQGNILRHFDSKGTPGHTDMGFATGTIWATNVNVYNEFKTGNKFTVGQPSKASCMTLGAHQICSDGGDLLTIKGRNGDGSPFVINSSNHSSFQTWNAENIGKWQGY